MTAAHVLISSTYYWPESTGNAPYVTGLAEHLARVGYRVTVVTGFPHYPAWRSTSGRRAAARESRANVNIQRRWHYVPRKPTASHRALYEATIASTGWTAFSPRLKPDVVLAIVPTLAAGLLGSVAAKAYRVPFGLVFQDLMGPAATQNGLRAARWLTSSLSRTEVAIARRADQIGVITEGFRTYLEQKGVSPRRVVAVRNWAHPTAPSEDRAATRARLGWSDDTFICLHSGNMGQKQGLDNLLDAAAHLQAEGKTKFRVVLAGDGNDRQRLEEIARRRRLCNVSFLGFQEEGQYDSMLAAADLLVVHQRAALTNSALPSKLASYFNAGGPVLAVAAADSQTAVEVRRSGAGVLVAPDDPVAVGQQIVALAADRPALSQMGQNGREYANLHLNSDNALADYERFVAQLLEAKR